VYDEAKVRERWGVEPAQIADVLALMGDSIDNIPGVKGVGEKTAVKLITQFGGVDGIYQNLTLVAGKLRETLATNRKQALLSRELATVNRHVDLPFDLEAFRRVDPDWLKLRNLWMEMEFVRLVKELPAVRVEVSDAPVPHLASADEARAWLAKIPADEAVAVAWAGELHPPDTICRAVAAFHPAAGSASVALEALPAVLERPVVVHDAKPVIEWAIGQGLPVPRAEDSALAAYLLNPARATYKLDEICAEVFVECPPTLPAPTETSADEHLQRVVAERAKWVARYWENASGTGFASIPRGWRSSRRSSKTASTTSRARSTTSRARSSRSPRPSSSRTSSSRS